MPPDNAVIFRRKLSDAFIRSLTECGKHADGEVPGLYLEVMNRPGFSRHSPSSGNNVSNTLLETAA